MKRRKTWSQEEVLEGLAGPYLSEPPDSTLRKALALASRLPEPGPGLLRWLVSRVLDSAMEPAAAGVRRGLQGERRILIDLSIAGDTSARLDLLTLSADGQTFGLRGQLSPVRDDVTLEIVAGSRIFELPVSPVGDFVINNLPFSKGGVFLRVLTPGVEPVELRDIEPPVERD